MPGIVPRPLYVSQWLLECLNNQRLQGLATRPSCSSSTTFSADGNRLTGTGPREILERWERDWNAARRIESQERMDVGPSVRPGSSVPNLAILTMELDLLGLILPQGIMVYGPMPEIDFSCLE